MKAACKVCGRMREVDICGYCSDCYPYDRSTDLAHQEADFHMTTPARLKRHRGGE